MEEAHRSSRQTFQDLVIFGAAVDSDSLITVAVASALLVICSVAYRRRSRQTVAGCLVALALAVISEAAARSCILAAVEGVENLDADVLDEEPPEASMVAAVWKNHFCEFD